MPDGDNPVILWAQKKENKKPANINSQEQRVQQPNMTIGVTEPESLIEVAHAGRVVRFLNTEHRAPKTLFGFSRGDGVAA